jgi:hypothetical protein
LKTNVTVNIDLDDGDRDSLWNVGF